jgi:lincosamide nucleotidyltransferase A/C/D/E
VRPGITGGLTAAEALRVLAALDAVGLRAWVAGGWGVDALLGRQTRVHRDLDLALDVTHADLDLAIGALGRLGYGVETDWRPTRVELAAPSARWVDLHPVVFDEQGTGWQVDVDDLPPFRYPPEAFTAGSIDGSVVRCLSVAQQLLFHRGYPPRPHDLVDIALLEGLRERP